MQTRSIAAAVLVLSGASLVAQQAAPPQTPTFRTGVELVTVDVNVIDRQGLPLRGLEPSDFTVTVAGQPRRVVSAEYRGRDRRAGRDGRPPRRRREHERRCRRRPAVRLRRRSEHARNRQRAARGACGVVVFQPADVRRSVRADAAASRTEHQLHLGARSRACRPAARGRHEPPDEHVGVRQPG